LKSSTQTNMRMPSSRPARPAPPKSTMCRLSVFDLFKIGIGPSSSHTVGPMKAAVLFLEKLQRAALLTQIGRVQCILYGSLGSTGKGHGSDKAVILGLMGHLPDQVQVSEIPEILRSVRESRHLRLGCGLSQISFDDNTDIQFITKPLDSHPNGLRFTAFDGAQNELLSATYLSIGGGFVREESFNAVVVQSAGSDSESISEISFESADELISLTRSKGLKISELMRHHERTWRTDEQIDHDLLRIWQVMRECVDRGCKTDGILPGGFKVRRRAHDLFIQLSANAESDTQNADPLNILDWVNLFALAVNEENAAGGRVVTAPTNGAAGIIPAVLHYYYHFIPGASDRQIVNFLLTAGAIGFLYKMNASISGAEVGCQGEVGVACSMAAGALCEILGGTPAQVENAAEIAMEHHLGLTCDPVGGLVQIPCIERNAIASVKAINAARMALRGDGSHTVSLDQVIKTMWETGADMRTKYKETARGGLAVSIVEC